MRNQLSMPLVFLVSIFLIYPKASLADWRGGHEGRHFYRWHDHPHFGIHVDVLPDTYFTLWVGGARYYYYDGLYYNRINNGYVITPPPVGAVVSTIPADFQPVIINGMTYYTNNGVYYVYTPNGYQAVPQPVVQSVPIMVQPAPTPVTVTTDTGESFTVNIPNSQGGYTAVVIKRSGKGFVGPQGEFYSEFPKVSQLKAMYGK